MLVKVHVAVVLPHIDLKFLRRSPPSPAIVGIAQAVVALRDANLCDRTFRSPPDVKVAEKQSAQMRNVRYIAAAALRGTQQQERNIAVWLGAGLSAEASSRRLHCRPTPRLRV